MNAKAKRDTTMLKIVHPDVAAAAGPLTLIDVDLRNARLAGATMTGVNLAGANLTAVNLTRMDLKGVNLEVSDLIEANLKFADLSGANLSSANLYAADLTGANLTRANFAGATLTEARLTRCSSPIKLFRSFSLIPCHFSANCRDFTPPRPLLMHQADTNSQSGGN